MSTATQEHRAMIAGMTVASRSPYIVYGSARGLVSENKLLRAARLAAEHDRKDCAALGDGGYSEVQVYCWDDEDGWAIDATDE